MRMMFKQGDIKSHKFRVAQRDVAKFASGVVHPVCSTFTLAREIEWATRLFVLDMLEEGEEGIGTLLQIEHLSPALVGSMVLITATIETIKDNIVICVVQVECGQRVIAKGRTGQKIVNKERFNKNLARLAADGKR
jgi:predicted thioesterase